MKEQTAIKLELIKGQDMLYDLWLKHLSTNKIITGTSIEDIRKLTPNLLKVFIRILQYSNTFDLEDSEFVDVKTALEEFSKTMVAKRQAPTSLATYIYSLKSPLSTFLQSRCDFSPEILNEEILKLHDILDKMVLYTFEYFVKEREKVIQLQQEDMVELSTPVIKAWNEILTVPVIGTLDSKRTQIIMENLLGSIIATSSKVVILDISGVSTVDTYVANDLINTTTAARLLGAEIIITGISPSIAQIIVHLGINLSGIITRALLEDGFKLALEMCGYKITKVKNA